MRSGDRGTARARDGRPGVARSVRWPGLGVALCLVVVLVTGCGAVGGLFDDAVAEPAVGQCHRTPDAVLPDAHDPTAPVECTEPHTLETFAVLHTEVPPTGPVLARAGARCAERVSSFLGGAALARSALGVFYFAPSRAQREQGARWVRCDVGVLADTAGAEVRRVTGSLQGAFAGGVPQRYRRCLDGRPDPRRAQPLVPCLQPHVAELAPEGVDVGNAERPYPGTAELAARANRRCARLLRGAVPGAARVMVVVPTRAVWASGTTTAQCWGLAAPGERLGGSETQTT